jgi:uncharacterized protein YabE (DUF348 family)
MNSLLRKMPGYLQILLVMLVILAGLSLLFWSQIKSYQLIVDGETYKMRAIAFYPRHLVKFAGIELQKEDKLSLNPDKFHFSLPVKIYLTSARPVQLIFSDGARDSSEILSAALYPADILKEAGIMLFPKDIIKLNGKVVEADFKLNAGEEFELEYLPAKQIDIFIDGHAQSSIFTQSNTFKEALSEAKLSFHEKTKFDPALNQTLEQKNRLEVGDVKQFCLTVSGSEFCDFSGGENLAEVLADLAVSPQGLDFTQPAEDQSLPDDGKISLHKIEERLILSIDETAVSYTYQEDPNTQLDTTAVLIPAQPGIEVARTVERLQDGNLLSSQSEAAWKASEPRDGLMGRGTKAVMQTETVDGEELQFWRKVSVYATSYHPSTFGDNPRTRSGMPLAYGTIAVSASWYPSMVGQSVYVRGYGYGRIGDSGGGIPGTPWIDLGYSDEDYVGWHSWTTMYFLSPIPAWYPAVLP